MTTSKMYNRIVTLLIASFIMRTQAMSPEQEPAELEEQYKNYLSLCDGRFQLSNDVTKKLLCYYTSGPHHFLRYARVKVEQMLLNPGVVMFHDIISDHEMEHIKDVAAPQLKKAVIQGVDNGKLKEKYSETRTNKMAWVFTQYSNTVLRFAQRISDVTGLDVGYFPIQVAKYDTGEYYYPHYDYFTGISDLPQISISGNRLASIVVYMSEVSEGGATVFIHPRLAVFPVKGSALFWRNLLPSGEGDPETLHSGCPVKRGVKWVSVIWKYEIDDRRKQCSIQSTEKSLK